MQEALCHTVRRLGAIRPVHTGGLEAYLRAAVLNRIRDEMRKVFSRPTPCELDDSRASTAPSPLELAIGSETVTRYKQALLTLRPLTGRPSSLTWDGVQPCRTGNTPAQTNTECRAHGRFMI